MKTPQAFNMDRDCGYCGKRTKSSRGLEQHIKHCSVRFGTKLRIRLREENRVIKEDLPLSLPFSSIVCEGEHVLAESRSMHDKNVGSSADAGEHEFQDTSLIVGFNDNFVKSFPYGFGILSTSSSIRIETPSGNRDD